MKPQFITFTGLDERTDLHRVVEMSSRYPLEWGVLFSQSRQGNEPRYPSADFIKQIEAIVDADGSEASLAAHICGGYSRMIMAGEDPDLDISCFTRAQINTTQPDVEKIAAFGKRHDVRVITQHRDVHFPEDDSVAWLYDRSGGRGEAPEVWPTHPGGSRMVGYAGGLNSDNVRDTMSKMDRSGRFWIDMENGVRTDDWLDLDRCQAVCEAVYGY